MPNSLEKRHELQYPSFILERVVRIQHRLGGLVTRVALDATVFTPFGRKCVLARGRALCDTRRPWVFVSSRTISCFSLTKPVVDVE